MRLSDHILAARGSFNDFGGIVTATSSGIVRAERFIIEDDVAEAAVGVVRSRPSSLVNALPLCRLPYPVMWMEWVGARPNANNDREVPTPKRMGVLIEATDDSLQCGTMTWAWLHDDKSSEHAGINVCPIGCWFDWRPEGNLTGNLFESLQNGSGPAAERLARANPALRVFLDGIQEKFMGPPKYDEIRASMLASRMSRGWDKLANDPREVEAVMELCRHAAPWPTPHTLDFLAKSSTLEMFPELVKSWIGDLEGEEPFVAALITMMNSRNCLETESVDLFKLNRSRRRSGKAELLPYAVTKLRIAQHLRRAIRDGQMSREEARGHKVRGHFKLRSTGVFWWTPHERGDRTRVMPRHEYEVAG